MTPEELQERKAIVKWVEKQPWYDEYKSKVTYPWPKGYLDGIIEKGLLISGAFCWQPFSDWPGICKDFLQKLNDGYFKTSPKPTKLDPKTFSMVRKREKKYKLKYKI